MWRLKIIYLKMIEKEHLNNRKIFWNKVAEKKVSIFSKFYRDVIIKTYKFLIPKESKILEIGSGSGDLIGSLMPSYGVGIDVSTNMINFAKKKYPKLHFYEMSGESLNLEKKRILYFLKFKNFLRKKKLKILIKLHPSENKKKYNWLKRNFSKDIFFDNRSNLKNLLLKSTYVIGCNSMAMVVATNIGKKVFDALPPGDEKNKLPFKNIKKLRFIK